eukprot:61440-Rhodomonas_salina.2
MSGRKETSPSHTAMDLQHNLYQEGGLLHLISPRKAPTITRRDRGSRTRDRVTCIAGAFPGDPELVGLYRTPGSELWGASLRAGHVPYAATNPLPCCEVRYCATRFRAMKSAWRAIGLRACYAMPGTDLAYAATRPLQNSQRKKA